MSMNDGKEKKNLPLLREHLVVEDGKLIFDDNEISGVEEVIAKFDEIVIDYVESTKVDSSKFSMNALCKEFIMNYYLVRLLKTSKVRYDDKEIKSAVKTVSQAIELFNSLDEFTTKLWDRDLEDIPVLGELKDFVIPESVRVYPNDLRCENLIVKSKRKETSVKFMDYINAISKIRSLHRLGSNDNVVSLKSLKQPKSLSEVIDKACLVEGEELYVNYSGTDFVPIELNNNVLELFKEYWFNFDADIIMNNLAANLFK